MHPKDILKLKEKAFKLALRAAMVQDSAPPDSGPAGSQDDHKKWHLASRWRQRYRIRYHWADSVAALQVPSKAAALPGAVVGGFCGAVVTSTGQARQTGPSFGRPEAPKLAKSTLGRKARRYNGLRDVAAEHRDSHGVTRCQYEVCTSLRGNLRSDVGESTTRGARTPAIL